MVLVLRHRDRNLSGMVHGQSIWPPFFGRGMCVVGALLVVVGRGVRGVGRGQLCCVYPFQL